MKVLAVFILMSTALIQAQPQSGYITIPDSMLHTFVVTIPQPRTQVRFEWEQDAMVIVKDDKTLTISFGDTLRATGDLHVDTAAMTFFDAVHRVMMENEERRWSRLAYISQSFDAYESQLTAKYRKVLELFLKQIEEDGEGKRNEY